MTVDLDQLLNAAAAVSADADASASADASGADDGGVEGGVRPQAGDIAMLGFFFFSTSTTTTTGTGMQQDQRDGLLGLGNQNLEELGVANLDKEKHYDEGIFDCPATRKTYHD